VFEDGSASASDRFIDDPASVDAVLAAEDAPLEAGLENWIDDPSSGAPSAQFVRDAFLRTGDRWTGNLVAEDEDGC
jgi:hypothetical protein